MQTRNNIVRCLSVFLLSLFLLNHAHLSVAQGFLELPNTAEVPAYESESMLLDLDIPSVRERDPDPDAGPRLNVKAFRLQGLVEFPKLGITRQGLIDRVEGIRFDLMKEGQMTKSGYTLDELGEVSDLIAEIEEQTDKEHVGPLEVQKLVFLVREQRRKRGVTVGLVETVADEITRYYRERGFILAKAYIPKQQVRDGVVTLTLLLGELGEINIENNNGKSNRLISQAFSKRLHEPVTSWNIEESLYFVNDIPGLSARGFFSPGSQVGDTKLNVNVTDIRRFDMNFRIDNHGSKNTSENRVYTDFFWYNPTGAGDELHIAVLNSFAPATSTFGSLRYSRFLRNPRWRTSAGYSLNEFLSRNTQIQNSQFFKGTSAVADISLAYHFKRSRVKNYSANIKLTDVATTLDAGIDTEQSMQKISFGFNFDLLNQKRRQLYAGGLQLHVSQFERDSGFGLETGNEAQLGFDISRLSFPNIPFTKIPTRLLLKTSGQFAGKALSNLNQVSLTGAQKARGFDSNTLQTDDGIYFGADWFFSLAKTEKKFFGQTLDDVIQPYIFTDVSWGIIHGLNGSDANIDVEIANVGVGLKFTHRKFSADILATVAIDDKLDDAFAEFADTRSFYVNFQYRL